MPKKTRLAVWIGLALLAAAFLTSACGTNRSGLKKELDVLAYQQIPVITGVTADRAELPLYESLELTVSLKAIYNNPYDARQVSLDGVFIARDGKTMQVPGFWDGESSWKVRFTPSELGEWTYRLTVTDAEGTSLPTEGVFNVTGSDLHGWIQAGNWVNPAYSSHYLVYQDGMPFYGIGHADALDLFFEGYNTQTGVSLFNQMRQAGENYVVWWPLWQNSPIDMSYDDYDVGNLKMIDAVVADAQKKGIFLIFTIWDHPELRDNTHIWGSGFWDKNGFNQLGDISSFFTSPEAWAWQENFYRYIIARWGYSPAIGMWQTVSEIDGTNAFSQTDSWHAKVNDYFVKNDPYHHPTTASMSGGKVVYLWPAGQKVMDVEQVHVYAGLENNPVGASTVMAKWTWLMWNESDKPNWIGEFGVEWDNLYPELFHNAIWATLGAGGAMTPAEWNSGGSWGELTTAMLNDLKRLGMFVGDIPLAELNPSPLQMTSNDPVVHGWGVAGKDGGLFWVQDLSLEGKSIQVVRSGHYILSEVDMEITGLAGGTFTITPYDTWKGKFLEPFEVTCTAGQSCNVPLPDFRADMAFKIERK